jgi:hypothetical protein
MWKTQSYGKVKTWKSEKLNYFGNNKGIRPLYAKTKI